MAAQLLNVDKAIVEQCSLLGDLDATAQVKLINWAVDILEGKDVTAEVQELCQALGGVNPSKISRLCTAISALLWECSKYIIKEANILPQILSQMGMTETVIPVFTKGFTDNMRRLSSLKDTFGVDAMSYGNLSWRLDVILAQRSLLSTAEPTFQLKLDLVNHHTTNTTPPQPPQGSTSSSSTQETHHLQCNYANLKLLQSELQRAIDEHSGVHSQRISRYIS